MTRIAADDLLRCTDAGLYCPPGDFYIDPWRPVRRAVITHAHFDHARPGCQSYLTSEDGTELARLRVGGDAVVDPLAYGDRRTINGVHLSLHPAGHVLGSVQVRLAYRGHVVVVTGDYKRDGDPTCRGFEPLPCHTLVTECTFGLPVFRWPPAGSVFAEINQWWRDNRSQGRASVLYGYAIGKAQRLIAGVHSAIGPILTHGAVERGCAAYRRAGIRLPPTRLATNAPASTAWQDSLIVAPPSARGTRWLRRFGRQSSAMASGWMRVRGIRRRRALDRGFVLSDHVDWPQLLRTIQQTQADYVWLTHGYAQAAARYCVERGIDACALEAGFRREQDDEDPVSDHDGESGT